MYNSGFTAQDPNNTGPNTGLNDLGCNLTSCWAPTSINGRQLSETSTGSKIYYFPSKNFNSCYSGQIIAINNQTSSNINMKNDDVVLLYDGKIVDPSANFTISTYLYVFMFVGDTYWIQISRVKN